MPNMEAMLPVKDGNQATTPSSNVVTPSDEQNISTPPPDIVANLTTEEVKNNDVTVTMVTPPTIESTSTAVPSSEESILRPRPKPLVSYVSYVRINCMKKSNLLWKIDGS